MNVFKLFVKLETPSFLFETYIPLTYLFWDWPWQTNKTVNRKFQGMPQSQIAANPRHQEEEKKDKNMHHSDDIKIKLITMIKQTKVLLAKSTANQS